MSNWARSPELRERPESDADRLETDHNVDHLSRKAPPAIQTPGDQRVALTGIEDRFGHSRAICLGFREDVGEHLRTAGGGPRVLLKIKPSGSGREAYTADEHG